MKSLYNINNINTWIDTIQYKGWLMSVNFSAWGSGGELVCTYEIWNDTSNIVYIVTEYNNQVQEVQTKVIG